MSFSPHPPLPLGCNGVQKQRDLRDKKRNRISMELVNTEQHYCQQLQLVTTYFVEILKAKETLRQDIREGIFSSIKDILSANQSLLVHLENGYFGKGLDSFCLLLHHYNIYVDNIYNARKMLEIQLKKNKAFRRFKKLQESRPEFNSCKLEDLLQMPIQRIAQYEHFLQDLTANTNPYHPEFEQLSRAVSAVCEVSQRIQENTRHHENHLQLLRVQKMLKGRKTRVLVAGRWYIREGWLRIVPSKGVEAKSRMFFLFSDVLLQAKHCSPLHPTNGEKFSGQHIYPLQDSIVEKVFGHTKSKGGLLSLTFPKAKLLLMSSNQKDLNDWYECLSSAIRKLNSKPTVIHQKDELCNRPLSSVVESNNITSSSSGRKRNKDHAETSEDALKLEQQCTASKRIKPSDAQSASDASSSSCVIL